MFTYCHEEDLRTEFKREWKNEYFRNIAAFANTEGETLYLGMDNHGNAVGIGKVETLLKVLPDKIQNVLRIVAIVDDHSEGDKEYITVKVNPSPEPIFL